MLFSIESIPGEHLKGAMVCGLWEAPVRGHTTTLYPLWAEKSSGGNSLWALFIFWLTHTACGILNPWLGIEPESPAMESQSLNHWTTGEVPATGLNMGLRGWEVRVLLCLSLALGSPDLLSAQEGTPQTGPTLPELVMDVSLLSTPPVHCSPSPTAFLHHSPYQSPLSTLFSLYLYPYFCPFLSWLFNIYFHFYVPLNNIFPDCLYSCISSQTPS